ncbi:MAG: nucleotidyltransferase family protein [Anaerolineae bacterium]|nr:nucleotidyltransferase family protein [Anaerolineae bacterium]
MEPNTSGARELTLLARILAGHPPAPEVDWPALAGVARRQGVLPLLYWQLKQWYKASGGQAGAGTALPPALHDELRRDFAATAARVMAAKHPAAAALRALADAGVPAIVLKGPAAGAFYPNPALRSYVDLDLLVPRPLVDRAEAALAAEGYRAAKSKPWALEYGYDLPMVGPPGEIAVEIHWQLDYPDGIGHLPVEEMWPRAVPWGFEGQEVLRLEDVDAVLYLCTHALVKHHAHLGLRPVCDLMHAVRGWPPDRWDTLAERATAYGVARPVHLMLVLAERLTGVAPPPGTATALRPPLADALPDDLVERLLVRNGSQRVVVPRVATQAGARGRLSDRLRHLWWHTFLPREGMEHKYGIPAGSPRIWLTYLWRPIDLVRRYGRTAWNVLKGTPGARQAWEREAWLERWLRGEVNSG